MEALEGNRVGSEQGKPGEGQRGPQWPDSVTCAERDTFLSWQHRPQNKQKEEQREAGG